MEKNTSLHVRKLNIFCISLIASLVALALVKGPKRFFSDFLVLLKKIGNPVINNEYSKDKILKFLKKELSN